MTPPTTRAKASPRPWPRWMDAAVALWVGAWLLLGVWTGYEIRQLTQLSQATVESGRSLQSAATALGRLRDLPVVGDAVAGSIDPLVAQVDSTAGDVVASGHRADRSVRSLAVLIGLAVGIGPSGPVLLLYLPLRTARPDALSRRVVPARSDDDQHG